MGAGASRATPRTRLKPLAPGVPLAPSSMNTVAYFSVDTGKIRRVDVRQYLHENLTCGWVEFHKIHDNRALPLVTSVVSTGQGLG